MALNPHLVQRFSGLATDTNPFKREIEGAMSVADNCVVAAPDVLESRRGYSALAGYGNGVVFASIDAIGFKQGQLLALSYNPQQQPGPSGEAAGAWELRRMLPASWSTLPMFPGALPLSQPGAVAGIGTQFVSANKALYFQSANGLTKIEDISTGVCRPAIQPVNWSSQGPGGLGLFPSLTTGNWLANNTQVAYCVTTARYGTDNELIESEPSERIILLNASGVAKAASLRLEASWMMPQDSFFRLWRTVSSAAGVDPGAEFFLVAEVRPGTFPPPTSNGYLSVLNTASIVDATPDGSLYVPLYCNAITGPDGAGSNNTPAPLAGAMAYFRNRLYCLNTGDVQRLEIKVIGTGAGGIQAGDTLTIAGIVFTFTNTITTAPQLIPLISGSSVANNIDATARYICQAVNIYFGSVDAGPLQGKILARYLSTDAANSGQVLLQSLMPGTAVFALSTSSANGWGSNYTAGVFSDGNVSGAGLAWSKPYQPESFPLGNNEIIGSPSKDGLALVPLRDQLFAFKKDGLWQITDDGSTLGPKVDPFDPTVKLLGRRTAVSLDNNAFCFTEQGVLIIGPTGKANISFGKVENELLELSDYVGAATMDAVAFGVAYEQENLYILCVPESPNATTCTRQYVYSTQTQAWTCWRLPGVVCGGVSPGGVLYWGMGSNSGVPELSSALWSELQRGSADDYQDPSYSRTPTGTGQTLVFPGNQTIRAGDLIQQFQATNALCQRVMSSTYASGANQTTVVLDAAPKVSWSGGPVAIVPGIDCTAKFLPFHAGQPLTDKEWSDCFLAFSRLSHDSLSVTWFAELYPKGTKVLEQVSQYGSTAAAPIPPDHFGSAPFGQALWDKQSKNLVLKCTMEPAYKSSALLGLQLQFRNALARWELAAIDIKINGSSDRVAR
jgi:hypothetical protein